MIWNSLIFRQPKPTPDFANGIEIICIREHAGEMFHALTFNLILIINLQAAVGSGSKHMCSVSKRYNPTWIEMLSTHVHIKY